MIYVDRYVYIYIYIHKYYPWSHVDTGWQFFLCGFWVHLFPPILGEHEAKHGSLNKISAGPVASDWQEQVEKLNLFFCNPLFHEKSTMSLMKRAMNLMKRALYVSWKIPCTSAIGELLVICKVLGCHTYEWFTLRTSAWVMRHVWMRHVMYVYEWGMVHM